MNKLYSIQRILSEITTPHGCVSATICTKRGFYELHYIPRSNRYKLESCVQNLTSKLYTKQAIRDWLLKYLIEDY